jgi:hypothetical protein
MGTAFEGILGNGAPRQKASDTGDVFGLTAVRRAAERQLGRGNQPGVRHSILHERQGLERLGRRSKKGDEPGVPDRRNERSIRAGHGSVDPMSRFDDRSTPHHDRCHNLTLPAGR